jgi:hypothetical protein
MGGLTLKRNLIISLVVVILTMAVLTGCDSNMSLLYVGSDTGDKISGSYKLFTGTKSKTINAEKGETIVIDYSSEVKSGELALKVLDPDKEIALELETNKAGTEEINAEKDGKYRLIITGNKTNGSFNVKWDVK